MTDRTEPSGIGRSRVSEARKPSTSASVRKIGFILHRRTVHAFDARKKRRGPRSPADAGLRLDPRRVIKRPLDPLAVQRFTGGLDLPPRLLLLRGGEVRSGRAGWRERRGHPGPRHPVRQLVELLFGDDRPLLRGRFRRSAPLVGGVKGLLQVGGVVHEGGAGGGKDHEVNGRS